MTRDPHRSGREESVTAAFVTLVNSLVGPFDVVELLIGLTQECARILDVAAAGLLLADRRGVLHVVAASSEDTRNLELFQLQRDQGPCLECYRSGYPVSVEDLSLEADRWPLFVPAATQAGFASVHAIPMQLLDDVLGTLGLFGTAAGALNEEDLNLGQALAHVASVAIRVGAATSVEPLVTDQLHAILQSRAVVEQAKGVLAYEGNLDMEEALGLLRRYALHHGHQLTEVARALTMRQLSAREVLGQLDHDAGLTGP